MCFRFSRNIKTILGKIEGRETNRKHHFKRESVRSVARTGAENVMRA